MIIFVTKLASTWAKEKKEPLTWKLWVRPNWIIKIYHEPLIFWGSLSLGSFIFNVSYQQCTSTARLLLLVQFTSLYLHPCVLLQTPADDVNRIFSLTPMPWPGGNRTHVSSVSPFWGFFFCSQTAHLIPQFSHRWRGLVFLRVLNSGRFTDRATATIVKYKTNLFNIVIISL